MLSFLKKSGNKASALQPAWHPNFRDVEHLPDIKAVRTSFFINALAIFLVGALLIYAGIKEYKLKELRQEVAVWEQVVGSSRASSDKAIASFKQFQALDKKLQDAEKLLVAPLVFSDLVYHLGATLPPGVRLNAIDYRPTGINLSGSVRGAPEVASGLVSDYLDLLRKDTVLKAIFGEIEQTSMSRNASGDGISMELALKFPVPAKEKK